MPRELVLRFPPSVEPPNLPAAPELVPLAAKKLRLSPDAIAEVRAKRVSFDARRRERAWRVALDVWEKTEEPPRAIPTAPPTFDRPASDAPRVVVIGSGPAGLFCALDLVAAGLNVTLLERGRDVQTRRRPIRALNRGEPADRDCNYCFGEGGAGTYSDGKLYTRSGKKADIRGVLELLVAHGAPPEILVSWRPHIGSNRLPQVVEALRETLLRSGCSVRFGMRAEEIETGPDRRRAAGAPSTKEPSGSRSSKGPKGPTGSAVDPRVAGVLARDLDRDALERFAADAVVLATGHSALDALEMSRRAGARLEAKGFAMGVRIEHAQDWLDARQYGGLREEHADLPASFYELSCQAEERGVYSFCMCPGGFIVPSTTAPERLVVNGMSLARRDSPYANSGLVVAIEPEDWCGARGERQGFAALLAEAARIDDCLRDTVLPMKPSDDPLFGVRLQLALETLAARAGGGSNRAPCQRADAVAEGSARTATVLPTSYRPGARAIDLATLLPPGLHERIRSGLVEFDRKLPGFASEHGQLLGVESRTSSPVRIVRDRETLACPELAGLYPSGEGAGYAGGIVSAALDGRRVARAIVGAYAR